MNAPPSLDYQIMDFTSLEDKMDLASSPFPHIEEVEDLEFEFEQMDNRPPDQMTDNVMDDANEEEKVYKSTADDQDVEFLEDQDVQDTTHQDTGSEFDMKETALEKHEDEDEDILYEEEDEDATVVINPTETKNENDEYVQLLDDGNDDFLESDKPVDPVPVQLNAEDQSTETRDAQTDLPGSSSKPQDEPRLDPPQDIEEEVVDDDQATRDDGDGPTVNPIETEYLEDPDADRPEQPVEDGFLVEDPSEEVYNEEESIDVFANPATSTESSTAPLSSTKTNAEARAEQEPEVASNALTLDQEQHPVRVRYLDQEYALFPPRGEDSSDYFLHDSSLASEPLSSLLRACRDVMGKPQHVDDDDELVLDITSLGLHVCEDSKYAAQLKLSDIVEVYMALNQNENLEAMEPLHCNLHTRVCLSTQFNWLRDQAKTGVTFSDIAVQHSPEPVTDALPVQEDPVDQVNDVDDTTNEVPSEVEPLIEEPLYQTDGQLQGDQTTQIPDEARTTGSLKSSDNSRGAIAGDTGNTEDVLQFDIDDAKQPEDEPNDLVDPSTHDDLQADAPDVDAEAEASELLQDAIDLQVEEQEEDDKEAAEDQVVLQDVLDKEQVEVQSMLADEAAYDDSLEDQDEYDADEFLIPSDDELAGQADQGLEYPDTVAEADVSAPAINAADANGEHLRPESSDTSKIDPTTPSKKTSKRKVSDEEDDLILELDTPEPKRRRPS